MSHDAHAHPNPNPHDDPSAAPLFDVGTLATIVFAVAVGAIMALYFQWESRYVEATYARDYPASSFYRQQDTALVVDRPAWVDKQAGVAAIRIDQAMAIVARDLAAGGDGLPDVAPPAGPAGDAPGAAPPRPDAAVPPRSQDPPEDQ